MPLSKLWDMDTFFDLALPALTTVFGLQMIRVLLPSLLWYLGDTVGISYVLLGVLALAIFLAGLLAAGFRRILGSDRALVVAIGGVGLMRLLEQLSTVPMIDLVVTIIGTILFMFFFPLYLLRTRGYGDEATAHFGRGFLLGFVLDTTIHGALGTLDLSWQPGVMPTVFSIALVIAQWALLMRDPAIPDHATDARFVTNLPLISIGPTIFIMQVVFQNVARATALTGFPPPMALGLILIANAIGLAASLTPIIPDRQMKVALIIGTGFLAVLASRPDPQTSTADFLYFFGNLLIVPFVNIIFSGLSKSEGKLGLVNSTLANGIGWFLFALMTFIYYISYNLSMPFSNTILPPLAIILVGLAAFLVMLKMKEIPGASDWTSATIAAVMIVIAIEVSLDWNAPKSIAGNGYPVRVMTYNLHNGFNTDGRLDLEAIAQTIEQAKPDVIGLQEVERGWYIDSSVDLLNWLSQRLKLPYVYGPTADRVWGNAILSRYPIKESRTEELPPRNLPLKRGYTWARIDVGSGEEMLFVVTHLHHIDGDTEIRQLQTPILAKFLENKQRLVFVGDFNAKPDAKEIATIRNVPLNDTFATIGSGNGFSWPSTAPNQRIDYIWYSSDLKVRDLKMPDSLASDHVGIAVTVEKK